MTYQFTAIYENGFLKPTAPIALAEGSRVELLIIPQAAAQDHRSPAEILAEIAALPMEPGGLEFSGREHDRVLYGEQGAR